METSTLKREQEALAAGNFEKAMRIKWQLVTLQQTDEEALLSGGIEL